MVYVLCSGRSIGLSQRATGRVAARIRTGNPKQTNSMTLTERNQQVVLLMVDFEALTAVLLKFISPGMLCRVNLQIVTDVSTNSVFETSVSTY